MIQIFASLIVSSQGPDAFFAWRFGVINHESFAAFLPGISRLAISARRRMASEFANRLAFVSETPPPFGPVA
ncbi:MAG TPA: hypothetical protein DDZ51_27925 [Planctomycetaceae bacterium]|nr:hypothetical protein [Planctomycetaceae bacterium]